MGRAIYWSKTSGQKSPITALDCGYSVSLCPHLQPLKDAGESKRWSERDGGNKTDAFGEKTDEYAETMRAAAA